MVIALRGIRLRKQEGALDRGRLSHLVFLEVLECLLHATSFQVQSRKQYQGARVAWIDLHDILQGRLRILQFSLGDVGTGQIEGRFRRFWTNLMALL